MGKKSILLINDLVGIGNLSSSAMLPILSYMGMTTYNLPTSLVSNNFGYGKYEMMDTTEYIKGVIPVWEKLGFRFDAIATGFIPSEEQAQIVSALCSKKKAEGTAVFVDPVMGDGGKLYYGMTGTIVDCMREMLSVADVCYPNYTEACYLSGIPFMPEGVSRKQAQEMLDALRKFGSKSVLITSIKVDGKTSVAGYDDSDGSYFVLGYEEIPIQFHGTGDVFSAILIGHILDGDTLPVSTRMAMDGVYNLINLNRDAEDPFLGIPFEKYLNIL